MPGWIAAIFDFFPQIPPSIAQTFIDPGFRSSALLPSQRPRPAASEGIVGHLERRLLDTAHRQQSGDSHNRAGASRLTAHDGPDSAAPMEMLPRDHARNDPRPMAMACPDWQPAMAALSHEPTEIRIARMLQ